MTIPKSDLEVNVQASWIVAVELTHKPTGIRAFGEDRHSSRRAYAIARARLEQKLEETMYARLL